MKFIVQEIKIPWDFVMELYRSQEYYNWVGEGFEIIRESEINSDFNPSEYCPVGSVEFVVSYLEKYFGKKPYPINCPDLLVGEIKQIHLPTPLIIKDEIVKSFSGISEFFIKSERTIKSDLNGKYKISDPILNNSFSDPVVIRPWIDDIVSEWRIFVRDSEILDIRNYTGDPFICPDRNKCKEFVKIYITDKPAYTLDIGVREDKSLVVLEVHDFFSCGTYGFSDYRKYPIMLWRWFKWFTKLC